MKKALLKKKFDLLPWNQPRKQSDVKHPDSPPSEERVSVLDNIDVPSAVLQTLAKGPKFVIAPKISREALQQAVQVEVAALAYALRWSAVQQPLTPTTSDSAIPPSLNKFCPFNSQRKEPPRDNIENPSATNGSTTVSNILRP